MRSVPPQDLLGVFTNSPVVLVDLQYGASQAELDAVALHTEPNLHRFPEALGDYDETAALLCALDLVVSVCTSVVHLAGALAVPVWVLAPHFAEWRYGQSGTEMIWYPSARVFRQEIPGDWRTVLDSVRAALPTFLLGNGE
jgi:hypothetical protein